MDNDITPTLFQALRQLDKSLHAPLPIDRTNVFLQSTSVFPSLPGHNLVISSTLREDRFLRSLESFYFPPDCNSSASPHFSRNRLHQLCHKIYHHLKESFPSHADRFWELCSSITPLPSHTADLSYSNIFLWSEESSLIENSQQIAPFPPTLSTESTVSEKVLYIMLRTSPLSAEGIPWKGDAPPHWVSLFSLARTNQKTLKNHSFQAPQQSWMSNPDPIWQEWMRPPAYAAQVGLPIFSCSESSPYQSFFSDWKSNTGGYHYYAYSTHQESLVHQEIISQTTHVNETEVLVNKERVIDIPLLSHDCHHAEQNDSYIDSLKDFQLVIESNFFSPARAPKNLVNSLTSKLMFFLFMGDAPVFEHRPPTAEFLHSLGKKEMESSSVTTWWDSMGLLNEALYLALHCGILGVCDPYGLLSLLYERAMPNRRWDVPPSIVVNSQIMTLAYDSSWNPKSVPCSQEGQAFLSFFSDGNPVNKESGTVHYSRGVLALLQYMCEIGTEMLRLRDFCVVAEETSMQGVIGSYGMAAVDGIRKVLHALESDICGMMYENSISKDCRTMSFDKVLNAYVKLRRIGDVIHMLSDIYSLRIVLDKDWHTTVRDCLLRNSTTLFLSQLFSRLTAPWDSWWMDRNSEAENSSPRDHNNWNINVHRGRDVMIQIFDTVVRVFHHMSLTWLCCGHCSDPWDEFFITPTHQLPDYFPFSSLSQPKAKKPSVVSQGILDHSVNLMETIVNENKKGTLPSISEFEGNSLWSSNQLEWFKLDLSPERLPYFISPSLAHRIWLAGIFRLIATHAISFWPPPFIKNNSSSYHPQTLSFLDFEIQKKTWWVSPSTLTLALVSPPFRKEIAETGKSTRPSKKRFNYDSHEFDREGKDSLDSKSSEGLLEHKRHNQSMGIWDSESNAFVRMTSDSLPVEPPKEVHNDVPCKISSSSGNLFSIADVNEDSYRAWLQVGTVRGGERHQRYENVVEAMKQEWSKPIQLPPFRTDSENDMDNKFPPEGWTKEYWDFLTSFWFRDESSSLLVPSSEVSVFDIQSYRHLSIIYERLVRDRLVWHWRNATSILWSPPYGPLRRLVWQFIDIMLFQQPKYTEPWLDGWKNIAEKLAYQVESVSSQWFLWEEENIKIINRSPQKSNMLWSNVFKPSNWFEWAWQSYLDESKFQGRALFRDKNPNFDDRYDSFEPSGALPIHGILGNMEKIQWEHIGRVNRTIQKKTSTSNVADLKLDGCSVAEEDYNESKYDAGCNIQQLLAYLTRSQFSTNLTAWEMSFWKLLLPEKCLDIYHKLFTTLTYWRVLQTWLHYSWFNAIRSGSVLLTHGYAMAQRFISLLIDHIWVGITVYSRKFRSDLDIFCRTLCDSHSCFNSGLVGEGFTSSDKEYKNGDTQRFFTLFNFEHEDFLKQCLEVSLLTSSYNLARDQIQILIEQLHKLSLIRPSNQKMLTYSIHEVKHSSYEAIEDIKLTTLDNCVTSVKTTIHTFIHCLGTIIRNELNHLKNTEIAHPILSLHDALIKSFRQEKTSDSNFL